MLENVQKVDKMSFCPAKMAINTVKMAYLLGLKISCNFVSYIYSGPMEKSETQVQENWYAVKVFFNKVFLMENILLDMGLETYLATEKVQLKGHDHMAAARKLAQVPEGHRPDNQYIQEGPVIYKRVPMVSSIIFVKATEEEIVEVSARLKPEATGGRFLGFVYRRADWKGYAVIPPKQMESFRLLTQKGSEGLAFYSDGELVHYRSGDKVRVTEGPLKGAEGYIKRIKKDKRLLVCIEGVIAVATSYIPAKMLEPITE